LSQRIISGLAIGDLVSRSSGDLNYDGLVNLRDWDILNDANPAAAAAAWNIISGVPEPGTLGLAALAMLGYIARRRSRNR
jgi:hypothetical protein